MFDPNLGDVAQSGSGCKVMMVTMQNHRPGVSGFDRPELGNKTHPVAPFFKSLFGEMCGALPIKGPNSDGRCSPIGHT